MFWTNLSIQTILHLVPKTNSLINLRSPFTQCSQKSAIFRPGGYVVKNVCSNSFCTGFEFTSYRFESRCFLNEQKISQGSRLDQLTIFTPSHVPTWDLLVFSGIHSSKRIGITDRSVFFLSASREISSEMN